MYGKIFSSAFTGSMMGSGSVVFAVWSYVIAHTVDSRVELYPRLVAAVIGEQEDKVIQAIEFLCAPDPSSRSPENDGKRLIREGQFQYFVTNHERYRSIRNQDERREYNRESQRKSRASRKLESSLTVNDSHQMSALSAHTDTEAETERNTCPESDLVREVFDHWKKVHGHPKARLDSARMTKIKNALKQFSVDDLKFAISGYKNSDYHMGKNEQGTVYDEITLFLRNASHIERGIRLGKKPVKRDSHDIL